VRCVKNVAPGNGECLEEYFGESCCAAAKLNATNYRNVRRRSWLGQQRS
jgi:hypothetical protein